MTRIASRAHGKVSAHHQPSRTSLLSTRSKQEQDHSHSDTDKSTKTFNPDDYAKPFCDFVSKNSTVFHAVDAIGDELRTHGFQKLSERTGWKLERGGKYYVERNGSSMIAFVVGDEYEPGNGAAMLAGHVDALTAKLKPISKVPDRAGYIQLGVAPYAGSFSGPTWWDRDLGIGGRVLIRESNGKIVTKLVKLDWPIARIPTLAPHFGAAARGPFNLETQMVPIIGLETCDSGSGQDQAGTKSSLLMGEGTFASTQPPGLVKAIANELGIEDCTSIMNWELELFDTQPAQLGGINKEFLFAGRLDDKLCSWAAIQALIESSSLKTRHSGIIKVVALFDNEEIGSLLKQGARGNLLHSTIERVVDNFRTSTSPSSASLAGQTFANGFLVSSDVIHAVNPNFRNAYLENHSPQLNVGLTVSADPNGHMTTDAVSTAVITRCAELCGAKLQVFQIRNDSRSGGTVGPMLSSAMGVRAVDAGIPQLSMHSIRATTGRLDPGLGVHIFKGYLDHFEKVDKEFK